MMMTEPRSSYHPGNAALSGTSGQVQIAPSREALQKVDPSLSFQVTSPSALSFDVIVATEPTLFDPGEAHRRTPKNFRSSRQDFQGTTIDIETGFYMLPRAFLRDALSVEPRPTRLYYIAAAYLDDEAQQAQFSVPEAAWDQAPYVTLAADISIGSLSKVLGVAVERLGVLNTQGRVMRATAQPAPADLPRQIGGLPLTPDPRFAPHPLAPQPIPVTSPAPEPVASAAPIVQTPAPPPVVREPINGNGNGNSNGSANEIINEDAGHAPPPPVATNGGDGTINFIDDDVVYGSPDSAAPTDGFHDFDYMSTHQQPGMVYNDGFGAMAGAMMEPASAHPIPASAGPAIPPLDAAPDAAPAPIPTEAQPPISGISQPVQPDVPTSTQDHDSLVRMVIDMGAGNRYDALNPDGAFKGRFGKTHPYYQRAHEGLRFGPHQVSQDSGELGELLTLMQSADPVGFSRIFGEAAHELLATTNATGPSSLDSESGRSTRVQPVGGKDIWEEPWVAAFRVAAEHPPFQAAMRAQIIARRLEPMLSVTAALGIDDVQGQAMVLAMAIHQGVDATRTSLMAAINPFDTPAKTAAALDALGHAGLASFQQANNLPVSDVPGPDTHFALIAALRELGDDSPVQVPDGPATLDLIVTAVPPGALGDALLKLRTSVAFMPADIAGAPV